MSTGSNPIEPRIIFPVADDKTSFEVPNQSNMLIIDGRLHCATHKQQVCPECGVDYSLMNLVSYQLTVEPRGFPPPSEAIVNQVAKLKEEGNALFRSKDYEKAISKYSEALLNSFRRSPWDPNQATSEETSVLYCNRAACYLELGRYTEALRDSENVTRLRRAWGKGYFRKGRALFGLGQYKEAYDTLVIGSIFEPEGKEIKSLLEEVKEKL
ncbi:hypothetical protein H4219_000398 [Mycoemilia scoparia]|uniref:Translocation protein sec72 n=1 Tax=Mycoemilia scoparia TaxID=417184 RepID=A0A9W8A3G7_9FUNG|nr:hypothetical protein H4219_000398 [Mycoemilia scoparia]